MTRDSFLQYVAFFSKLWESLSFPTEMKDAQPAQRKCKHFLRARHFFKRVAIFYVGAAWQQQNKFVLEPNFLFVSDHMRQIKKSFSRIFTFFCLVFWVVRRSGPATNGQFQTIHLSNDAKIEFSLVGVAGEIDKSFLTLFSLYRCFDIALQASALWWMFQGFFNEVLARITLSFLPLEMEKPTDLQPLNRAVFATHFIKSTLLKCHFLKLNVFPALIPQIFIYTILWNERW